MDALRRPLALEEHLRADHRRNARRVADRLRADFGVALLVVADVVHVVVHRLAVLHSVEDAADVRLALCARTKRRRVGQKRLQELDWDDLLSLEVDWVDAREAHVLKALEVCEIALAKGHEEADTLDALQVAAERLELLMVEKVHVLLPDLVEDILALDRHRRGLDPIALVERLAEVERLKS